MRRNFKELFLDVFGTPEGKTILWWLGDKCGAFSTSGKDIDPSRIALWNELMSESGIYAPERAGALMDALIETANKPVKEKKENDEEI